MSNSALDIQTGHCIADIGQEGWDALSGGRPFASHQWYTYGERAMAGCTPLYICVSRYGEPVARATFWLVRDEPLPVHSLPLRRALQAFLRVRPLLICRSPLADTSGLILPEPPLRQPALESILTAAHAYARHVRASFLVCDYLSSPQSALPDWPVGWSPVTLAEPGTCLAVTWNTFEAYLAGLSNSTWKDYRRQNNQAAKLNLTVSAASKVEEIDAALPLIRAVETQHGSQPKPWARAMLENAGMVPSTWISAHVDGQDGNRKLVGCGLLLSDQDVHLATLLGLDYAYSYVYFQIVYSAIRQAIAQHGRALRAGSGAYDLKQRLGFGKEDNNLLRFAGQGSLLNWLGCRAAG